MEKTRFMDIYKHLAGHGIDTYYPAQKEGECTAPYVVVKNAGTTQYGTYSSTQTLFDVLCYVPKNRYTDLEQFTEQIKTLMDELQPMIMPMHYETSAFYDDTVKAHMISIQYRNMRKFY